MGPSAHLAKASGHDCHETELFTSDFTTASFHAGLNVDVLWLGVQDDVGVDLILVCQLNEEAATLCEMDSVFELVLTSSCMWLHHLEVVCIKLGPSELILLKISTQTIIVFERLSNSVLNFSIWKSFWLVYKQLGAP